jgi:hypothetical protein
MTHPVKIVAVGLLTESNLRTLGNDFKRVYRVDAAPCFPELLKAIDEADQAMWRARDQHQPARVE